MRGEEPDFGESEEYHREQIREIEEKYDLGVLGGMFYPVKGLKLSYERIYHATGVAVARISNWTE